MNTLSIISGKRKNDTILYVADEHKAKSYKLKR